MKSRNFFIFTRTPLHVGAGASVGAIDQPVQRERHTGFPIIPASSLKGCFADQWPVQTRNEKDQLVRVLSKPEGGKHVIEKIDESGAAWLFGSDDAHVSFAGSLLFSEARVLAFPIRSAKGSYAWITCPLMLQRAARDGVLSANLVEKITEPADDKAYYPAGSTSPIALPSKELVLEEYCFESAGEYPQALAKEVAGLIHGDALFATIENRLVILSNGMMSHFVTTCCEVAQHVRINDETGTAEDGGLFNQENVPSETLFYSTLRATDSRVPKSQPFSEEKAESALNNFFEKVDTLKVFQFGGDASTGLGFCSVYKAS